MQAGSTGNTVHLIPVWNGTTFNQWHMSMNNGPAAGPPYPPMSVNKTTGPTITFTIVNPNGVQFDTVHPMYVKAGTAKPGSYTDPQFTTALSPDGHGNQNAVLTVTDTNLNAGPYMYVLNFQNNIPAVDPIINNGGPGYVGGGTRTYDLVLYAVGAVILIAMVVLVVRMMQRRT
jgi:hypothetical protein